MSYRRRFLDDTLDEEQAELVAVAIEGAKGVGKTATASRRAATTFTLSDERVRTIVGADVDVITHAAPPVFIDEWQLEPQVWERVRRFVDDEPTAGGQFILAGSAGLQPDARIHSGAGRIVSYVMRPMTLAERGLAEPTVSVQELFAGNAAVSGMSPLGLADYVDEILRSGFPGIRDLPDRVRGRQLDGYLQRVVDRDLPENGIAVRRPAALRAWLRAYAAATSSTADYTKILNAATAGQAEKPARSTMDSYREHLARLFLLDPVEAWVPATTNLARLAAAPKHHLVDPALAARLVGVGRDGLIRGEGELVVPSSSTWLGALFESLVVQSVRVYAESVNGSIGHLRTRNGDHEVDLIVETPDRRCVAFEVKLSATVDDKDVRHLNWLHEHLEDRLAARVLVNTGPMAYRRPDGVAVVPLALLGA